jgi:uncharacterized membrane protein
MGKENFQGPVKYVIGWILVLIIRFVPFRPPNVEPLMSTLMPFSKKYGWLGALIFSSTSIIIFDLASRTIGLWTLVTASAYGAIGVASAFYFARRGSSAMNYLKFSIMGTLAYDALTGLTVGPLFFGQSFFSAFYGQIPFTVYHLMGNITLSLIVSPLLYRWVLANPKLEISNVAKKLGFAI